MHANHLGHELHQSCSMEFDANIKLGRFINDSVEVREVFRFAHPDQVLQAIIIYASHWYGSMQWDLYGKDANKVYRAWHACVELLRMFLEPHIHT